MRSRGSPIAGFLSPRWRGLLRSALLSWNHNGRMRILRDFLAAVLGVAALTGPQANPQEQWLLEPELSIGSMEPADPNYALTTIRDLDFDPKTGRVYILQHEEASFKIFDPQGRLLAAVGREGEGPGEFRRPYALAWRQERLGVTDHALKRLSWFTGDGDLVESVTLHSAGGLFVPSDLTASGAVVGEWGLPAEAILEGSATRIPLLRVRRENLDTVATLDMRNTMFRIAQSPRSTPQTVGSRPISFRPFFAASPVQDAVILVEQRPLPTSPETFTISKLGPDSIEWTRRIRYEPQERSPALRDSIVDAWAAFVIRQGIHATMPAARRAVASALELPSPLPPVSGVVISHEGDIWVRREVGSAHYSVFDSGGRHLAQAQAPKGMEVLAATRNQAWAVHKDGAGVNYAVKLRIRRAAAD